MITFEGEKYSTDGGKTWKTGKAKVVSWKTFRHWRRYAMLGYAILAAAIVFGLYASYNVQRKNDKTVDYLCSTTSVLDRLVVAADKQLKLNFRNGTYDRLLKQGLLTKENVAAAKVAIKAYDDSHYQLKNNQACKQSK